MVDAGPHDDRAIFAEYAERERSAEADALSRYPKPKGKDILLMDAIKAEKARQTYIAVRMKEEKKILLEKYRLTSVELERIIREGKSGRWPTTREKS